MSRVRSQRFVHGLSLHLFFRDQLPPVFAQALVPCNIAIFPPPSIHSRVISPINRFAGQARHSAQRHKSFYFAWPHHNPHTGIQGRKPINSIKIKKAHGSLIFLILRSPSRFTTEYLFCCKILEEEGKKIVSAVKSAETIKKLHDYKADRNFSFVRSAFCVEKQKLM